MFLGICCFCHKNSYPSFKTEWRRGAGEWAGPVLAPLDTVPTLLRSPHGNWPCEPFTSHAVYHSSPSQDDGVLRDTIVHLFSINGGLADARCDGTPSRALPPTTPPSFLGTVCLGRQDPEPDAENQTPFQVHVFHFLRRSIHKMRRVEFHRLTVWIIKAFGKVLQN